MAPLELAPIETSGPHLGRTWFGTCAEAFSEMFPEMLQRLWDAASTGLEILTSSFASVGDKRQRDALAGADGGGSVAPTRLPLTEHTVTVNRHAL